LRAAVLGTAALHAHAIAAASLKVSPTGPFDTLFDDFYDFDPYGDRGQPAESLDGEFPRVSDIKPWVAPPRDGEFPFKGPHEGKHWENRLLIVPDKKLAFCYIEKNACTQFNRMMNALNGMSSSDEIPFWKSNSEGKFRRYFKWLEAGEHNISKASGWKLGIFLREPAERFLSAWLSKCDAWEYGGIDCLGPKVQDLPLNEKVEAFEKVVREVLPKYMASAQADGYFNAHYDPQSMFCGGRPLSEYDFVGELSGSPAHIQQQVVDMLKRDAGLNESDPLMDFPRVLFPSKSTAGHGTGSTNLMKQFYRNPEIYKRVTELYGADYRWASPMFKPN